MGITYTIIRVHEYNITISSRYIIIYLTIMVACFLFCVTLFSFGCCHGMWKFWGPGIKPAPEQWPGPLQWQNLILNSLHHKGTSAPSTLLPHMVMAFISEIHQPQSTSSKALHLSYGRLYIMDICFLFMYLSFIDNIFTTHTSFKISLSKAFLQSWFTWSELEFRIIQDSVFMHYNLMTESSRKENRCFWVRPGYESQFCHFPPQGCWPSYLTFCNLSFCSSHEDNYI